MQYAPRKSCLSCGGEKESSRLHRCMGCRGQDRLVRLEERQSNPFWETAAGKGLRAYQAGKRYCQRCDKVMEPAEFGREGDGAYCLTHFMEYRRAIERAYAERKRLLRPAPADPSIKREAAFLSEFGRRLERCLARKLARQKASKVRKCKLCHLVQPVSAFGTTDRRCNACTSKRKNRTVLQRNLFRRSDSNKKREWLDAIKLSSGCVDCGYREYPEALHFDHVDPERKSFGISRKGCGWTALKLEVEKCVVRCANCHAVRSRREGHSALRFKSEVTG